MTQFDIANTLADQLGIQYVLLETTPIEPEAMVDPLDYECIKDIGFNTNLEIKPLISTRKEILKAIKQHSHLEDSVENIVEETADAFKDSYLEIIPVVSQAEMIPSEDLRDKSQMAPIIRLFNLILVKALKARASDTYRFAAEQSVGPVQDRRKILKEEMSLPEWGHARHLRTPPSSRWSDPPPSRRSTARRW